MSEDMDIYSKIDGCESPVHDIMDAHQVPPRIKMTFGIWRTLFGLLSLEG